MLNGFIVLQPGGVPLYSKIVGMDLKVNTILLGGFFSAIQSFAHELSYGEKSFIKEMNMKNFIILYRQLEDFTFIGISFQDANIKNAQIILEYLILIFISKYRNVFRIKETMDLTTFETFDELFQKFHNSKEKELRKWLQKEYL